MNMIFVTPYFKKPDLISLAYANTYVTQRRFYRFANHLASVFGRKYQMIQQQCLVMFFVYMLAHKSKLSKYLTPTQASGNSLIKKNADGRHSKISGLPS